VTKIIEIIVGPKARPRLRPRFHRRKLSRCQSLPGGIAWPAGRRAAHRRVPSDAGDRATSAAADVRHSMKSEDDELQLFRDRSDYDRHGRQRRSLRPYKLLPICC